MLPQFNYPPELLQALARFKQMGAWSGSVRERKAKFEWIHRRLCEIYRKDLKLKLRVHDKIGRWHFSGSSSCNYITNTITLEGRLSVVTFLHEWGHALGLRGQEQAQAYAVGLFRLTFPEQFARLQRDGYCLVA